MIIRVYWESGITLEGGTMNPGGWYIAVHDPKQSGAFGKTAAAAIQSLTDRLANEQRWRGCL